MSSLVEEDSCSVFSCVNACEIVYIQFDSFVVVTRGYSFASFSMTSAFFQGHRDMRMPTFLLWSLFCEISAKKCCSVNWSFEHLLYICFVLYVQF